MNRLSIRIAFSHSRRLSDCIVPPRGHLPGPKNHDARRRAFLLPFRPFHPQVPPLPFYWSPIFGRTHCPIGKTKCHYYPKIQPIGRIYFDNRPFSPAGRISVFSVPVGGTVAGGGAPSAGAWDDAGGHRPHRLALFVPLRIRRLTHGGDVPSRAGLCGGTGPGENTGMGGKGGKMRVHPYPGFCGEADGG